MQFDSGYFVGAALMVNDRCVKAAPIIRWMIGKTEEQIYQTGKVSRWKINLLL